MKKNQLFFSAIIFFAVLPFSCQDKYLTATIQPAKGTLKSDITGNCLPKTIAGSYTINKAVNDSNFINITANITSTGTYTIKTDTVNGYYFRASGTFTVLGANQVKLPCFGKPVAAGTNVFKVSFDTSSCYISIAVLPASVPAVYTLQGNPSSCISDTVYGVYAAGATADTSNRLAVSINVTTPGSYSITTNTVNGYNFSGSGIVTATGVQTVILYATGTPLSPGMNNFNITGNTTTCTIPITVLTPVVVFNDDYFPITTNNYWNYDDLYNVGDTLQRIMTDSGRINGSLYKIMEERTQHAALATYNFRRVDSTYYEYGKLDKYTRALVFVPAIQGDIPFLKIGLKTGTTWFSDEFIGTISSTQPIYLQYKFVCDNDNATVTLNGKTFTHVYKVSMLPQIRSAITYPYNSTFETITIYYARGIGVIYTKFTNRSFVILERQIRNWKVY